jgi:SRSO17 transposase
MVCLSNGDHASLVDARQYLPKDWSDDPDRCKKAGIFGSSRVFKTKLALAYDKLVYQLELVPVFEFVSADEYYGAYIKEYLNLS